MPVSMQPHQLAFWRELLAPFPDALLSTTKRGGRELTYIDKRAITNRLDSVCGPHGWYPEYEATARGYKCRLYISVPTGTPGTFVFMHKEDGAGFEEMGSYNKQTNEWEADVDNDEKSGYTNALRRAAQDAWGIGRYLYGKGIPTFLDPNAVAPAAAPALPPVEPGPSPAAPPVELRDPPPPATTRPQAPPATAPKYDNFKIPRPGTSVFAWAKEMEKVFQTQIIGGLQGDGEAEGWGKVFKDWNAEQVNTVCLKAIAFIRELPTYQGQFEHLFPGGQPDPRIATTRGSGPATPPPTPGVNLADLRRSLQTKIQALVIKQTGKTADTAGLKAVFQAVAAAAKNGQGHAGEVPESLAKCVDAVWIVNMIALVDTQIAAACAPAEVAGDDVPF